MAVEALEVLAPGPLTTVQDGGRFGYRRYGVATSGALDSFSLRVGNLLVGNPEQEAALEITLFGLRLKCLSDLAVAVTGGRLQPYVGEEPLEMWRSLILKRGSILSFRGIRSGCRAYLAIGGGLSLPAVMGSRSTNLFSKFGGLGGRPLAKGDILAANTPGHYLNTAGRSFPQEGIPPYGNAWQLRILMGPQEDQFSQAGREAFIASPYQVSPQVDRAGIRLSGSPIERKPGVGESIISEGVICGAIQVPGDGQPIIILVETVTGGYRKIATVISADLPLLGQVKPGDTVRFIPVNLDEAYRALREMERVVVGVTGDSVG